MEVIILGDFNCDCLKNALHQTERMEVFLMANELRQMVREPTRVTSTCSSPIDVLITLTPNSFESTGVLSASFSDHLPIFGVLHGSSVKPIKHRCIETRLFTTQCIAKFNVDLKLNFVLWNIVKIFSDIDDKCYVSQSLFLDDNNNFINLLKKAFQLNL